MVKANPQFKNNGELKEIILSCMDISPVKKAEEERDRIITLSQDLICIEGIDGYFKYIKPAWEIMIGYSKNELLSQTLLNFIHPDDRSLKEHLNRKFSEGQNTVNFENRFICRDGSIRTILWTATYFKSEKLIYSIGKDITDRKKINQALRENEERFHQLFENMSSGVAVYEAIKNGEDFMFKDFNKTAEKIDQISRDELIGKSVIQKFPSIIEFALFDVFQSVWRTVIPKNHPIKFYNDNRISGWRENFVYRLPSGEIVSIYNDITERILAENKIKFQAMLLELVGQSVIAIDTDGKITYWNKASEQIYGWSTEEIIGKSIFEINIFPKDEMKTKVISEKEFTKVLIPPLRGVRGGSY